MHLTENRQVIAQTLAFTTEGTRVSPNELRWQPVSSINRPLETVADRIAQIEPQLYLLLTRYEKQGTDLAVLTEPHVCSVIWAPSRGALLRAMKMQIEADDYLEGDPVAGFLPEGVRSYGELLTYCQERYTVLETASHRIASDGAFIHRQIATAEYCFYFRSRQPDDAELPYAIQKKLKRTEAGARQESDGTRQA